MNSTYVPRLGTMQLLRRRIERGDEAAGQAVATARWRIHDELVRGNPIRIERPEVPGPR